MVLRNEFKNFTEVYSAVATNTPVVFYGGNHPHKKQRFTATRDPEGSL
jgi:hypothetical protein